MQAPVSLIIVGRNQSSGLPALLESVQAQSLGEIETLIVDNASEEPCESVVEAFRNKGLAVRAMRLAQRVSRQQACLMGVAETRGAVLAFAEAGDQFADQHSLARGAELMGQNDTDMVHFRCLISDEAEGRSGFSPRHEPLAPSLEGKDIFAAWAEKGLPADELWTKLYSRRLWERIAPVASQSQIRSGVSDRYLGALLMLHAERYLAIPDIIYKRLHRQPEYGHADELLESYDILHALVPHIRAQGVGEQHTALFIEGLKNAMRKAFEAMCLALPVTVNFEVPAAGVLEALRGVDPDEVFLPMLLASRQSNQRVNAIRQTISRFLQS